MFYIVGTWFISSIPIARSMQKSTVAFWVTVLLFWFIDPTYRTGR